MMAGLSLVLWFWQGIVPTPTVTPEPVSNIYFFLSIAVAAILSFIFGILITTVFFLSRRTVDKPNSVVAQFSPEIESPHLPIKQCPQCNSTYTDEDLTYCLRDGMTLKIVGSMPIPNAPEETKVFRH